MGLYTPSVSKQLDHSIHPIARYFRKSVTTSFQNVKTRKRYRCKGSLMLCPWVCSNYLPTFHRSCLRWIHPLFWCFVVGFFFVSPSASFNVVPERALWRHLFREKSPPYFPCKPTSELKFNLKGLKALQTLIYFNYQLDAQGHDAILNTPARVTSSLGWFRCSSNECSR